MQYQKTVLLPGPVVTRVNAQLTGPTEASPGDKIWEESFKFENEYQIKLDVVVSEDNVPVLRARLLDHRNGELTDPKYPGNTIEQDFTFEFLQDVFRVSVQRSATPGITEQAATTYVERAGVRCPHCDSDEIDAGPFSTTADDDYASCTTTCFSCGAKFRDLFRLHSVESVEGPKQNIGPPQMTGES